MERMAWWMWAASSAVVGGGVDGGVVGGEEGDGLCLVALGAELLDEGLVGGWC